MQAEGDMFAAVDDAEPDWLAGGSHSATTRNWHL
jgi:hypothetical protein